MYGLAAVKSIAAAPAPWAMVAMAVWAQSLLQRAFQRTNAATASAAAAATSALGLLLAGFALYGEEPGPATFKALLAGGVCLAIFGTAMLVTARSAGPHEELGAQGPGPP
jgi:drug/metabolite transporter (DMT)-like permease